MLTDFDEEIKDKVKEGLEMSDIQLKDLKAFPLDKDFFKREPMALFLLAVGKDMERYREKVFDYLGGLGEAGERQWQFIMEELWRFEAKGMDPETAHKRKKLYPQTLVEGRKYFLHGHSEKEEDRASAAA